MLYRPLSTYCAKVSSDFVFITSSTSTNKSILSLFYPYFISNRQGRKKACSHQKCGEKFKFMLEERVASRVTDNSLGAPLGQCE